MIADNKADASLKFEISDTLRKLAQVNPTAITPPMTLRLIDNLSLTDYYARYYSARTIGAFTHANPETLTPELMQTLFAYLESDNDSAARFVVGYIVFEIAMTDPNSGKLIYEELKKLQASPQPHLRSNAVRILEMITIGNIVNEARTDPNKLHIIKMKLSYMSANTFNNGVNEEGLTFAISFALRELEKLESNNK